MICEALIRPQSIAVVGASNDLRKPGGKVLKNLLDGAYPGELFAVNPRESAVQGVSCVSSVDALTNVELAILAIPAEACVKAAKVLVQTKNTKALIVLSAGFGEAGEHGKNLERELVDIVNAGGACLIGPNCIGILNTHYHGVFTSPIPLLDPKGCDLASSSGATAVFIMEMGIPLGLRFANVYSIGNAAQTGIEEVLEYMDESYDPASSAPVKLLYIEGLKNPRKFLKHARSLVSKGADIAAIKAGASSVGSRAASSHTGALASSDIATRALFRKAGVLYCSGREELLSVASIFHSKKPKGKNIAIITHAGGSAVLLADALEHGGLSVPPIEGPEADKLTSFLHPGSSVGNPIDFLATGTAEQLGIIIDFCEHKFPQIDAMVVVFGSPGLFDVENVYNVLSVKIDVCNKPIYPVLPSVLNARREMERFLEMGYTHLTDEVVLGTALAAVLHNRPPAMDSASTNNLDHDSIREIINRSLDGYLPAKDTSLLLQAAGIATIPEWIFRTEQDLNASLESLPYPLALKVVGPLHKTEMKGVLLHIKSPQEALEGFRTLMKIPTAEAVMAQPMIDGIELFLGTSTEKGFGHIIMCGFGGIFIEVTKDISAALTPVSADEAMDMIDSLKGQALLEGFRNYPAIRKDLFANYITRLSDLVTIAPEIVEMDINPLMATSDGLVAIDTRIKISKQPDQIQAE